MKCKLSYRQLLTMLESANWAADFYWENEAYSLFIKYTKIGQRIVQAMDNYPNNFLN